MKWGRLPGRPKRRPTSGRAGRLRSYFRQYYRYARGDGKADLWRKRHAIRYVIYLIALPALLLLSVFHSPWWLLVAAGRRACV